MENKITGILALLVPEIISEIAETEKVTETEACNLFYSSEVYGLLEREETKLWHLSARAICEMFRSERATGKIVFPEGN